MVHEKSSFLLRFFEISQKRLKLFWSKKIGRNHGISVYKKTLISEHRKNYIFRDNNCFVKMSVSRGVTKFFLFRVISSPRHSFICIIVYFQNIYLFIIALWLIFKAIIFSNISICLLIKRKYQINDFR